MWWSFGSGLLTGWCLIAWMLWQWFDYSDCDSAADSYTFADWIALTWQSTVLVIMTGLGQGVAIETYREQAQKGAGSESECFTDLEVVTYFVGGHHSVTPALAEGCLQNFESPVAGCGAPPS